MLLGMWFFLMGLGLGILLGPAICIVFGSLIPFVTSRLYAKYRIVRTKGEYYPQVKYDWFPFWHSVCFNIGWSCYDRAMEKIRDHKINEVMEVL